MCNDVVTGWLRRKRLDERAFLLRHVEVLAAWRGSSAPVARVSDQPAAAPVGELPQ